MNTRTEQLLARQQNEILDLQRQLERCRTKYNTLYNQMFYGVLTLGCVASLAVIVGATL